MAKPNHEFIDSILTIFQIKIEELFTNFKEDFTEVLQMQKTLISKIDTLIVDNIGQIQNQPIQNQPIQNQPIQNQPIPNHHIHTNDIEASRMWKDNSTGTYLNIKLEKRKLMYWKSYRTQKLAELYATCLHEDPALIPHKFRTKFSSYIAENEKNIRKNAEIENLKVEIEVLKARQLNQGQIVENIDKSIENWANREFGEESTASLMKIWNRKIKNEEEKSKQVWNKKEDFFISEFNKDREDQSRGREKDTENEENGWTVVNRRKNNQYRPYAKQSYRPNPIYQSRNEYNKDREDQARGREKDTENKEEERWTVINRRKQNQYRPYTKPQSKSYETDRSRPYNSYHQSYRPNPTYQSQSDYNPSSRNKQNYPSKPDDQYRRKSYYEKLGAIPKNINKPTGTRNPFRLGEDSRPTSYRNEDYRRDQEQTNNQHNRGNRNYDENNDSKNERGQYRKGVT